MHYELDSSNIMSGKRHMDDVLTKSLLAHGSFRDSLSIETSHAMQHQNNDIWNSSLETNIHVLSEDVRAKCAPNLQAGPD